MFLDLMNMLRNCSASDSPIAPTELYNETWMLRGVLHWLSLESHSKHALSFANGAAWGSEIWMHTQFAQRGRSSLNPDKLWESATRADAVIGHVKFGVNSKRDLRLRERAEQFKVLEAKISSGLSRGVTNAPQYGQAARTVACMAQALAEANIHPSALEELAFYIVAPEEEIENGKFDAEMDLDEIRAMVEQRVHMYHQEECGAEKLKWFSSWFIPTTNHIRIGCIAWEQLMRHLSARVPAETAAEMQEFYNRCLLYA